MVDCIDDRKKALRAQMRSLAKQNSALMAAESEAIAMKLIDMQAWKDAGTILVYASLATEVDTSLLLRKKGKRFVLPVVEDGILRLRQYLPGSLVSGYMGIMEPGADCPEIPHDEIGLAVVPGMAFDREGHRLGKGKGFYDRLLPKLTCPVIGLAFSWQMTGHVPVEEHDAPLSDVVFP